LSPAQVREVVEAVTHTTPADHGLPGRGWTLKKVVRWLRGRFDGCRGTVRAALKRAGMSWKKCKKLPGKADPGRRAEFLRRFAELYRGMCGGEVLLVYIDESHFHRDLDLGYTWSPVGRRAWRVSDCPGLWERINWYGAYDFTAGRCLIWDGGRCNGERTAAFPGRVADWPGATDRRVVIIRDGAPWHRAGHLKEVAARCGMELVQLPGYSPDLNPIEGLWKWMREEVTQHACHATPADLFTACQAFVEALNKDPLAVITRLWPRFDLDPEVEKLRLSE
jgi:transposase